MHAVKATWTNGRILPLEPVNWPEGSELLVEPVAPAAKIGIDESQWRDDPESVAAWIVAVENMQPLVWAENEREAYESYREESRLHNIQAVKRQMDEAPNGDGP